MIAIDTETTGLDHYHGARPFFVTVCDEAGRQTFYEWDVDPLSRAVQVPPADATEIRDLVRAADSVVGQNIKFDVAALHEAGIVTDWPWDRTHDTLLASHALHSSMPHDLTSLCLHYLGRDIQPLEKALEKHVKKCRNMVQQERLRKSRNRPHTPLAAWAIAESGRPDMPSARLESWGFDGWLPRAIAATRWAEVAAGRPGSLVRARTGAGTGAGRPARQPDLPGLEATLRERDGYDWRPPGSDGPDDPGHPYWTVLADYANADSASTLLLWRVLEAELRRRDLWEIYLERMKAVRVAVLMERHGITCCSDRRDALLDEYQREADDAERCCVNVASGLGYDLSLPKSGNNGSLLTFCFGERDQSDKWAPPTRTYLDLPVVEWTDTGNPSLAKGALETYLSMEERLSPSQLEFVRALKEKRARDTACNYLAGYTRFWLPWLPPETQLLEAPGWFVLHPSLNPCGTNTLRWSSSQPNEQNISKREGFNLRCVFGPAPGREWWSMDAKNIELRIPAYEAGEREMIALFEQPDDPPYYGSNHLLNFSTVYPDLWEQELGSVCDVPRCDCAGRVVDASRIGPHVKKKYAATWYQWCKNGDFAVMYGAVDRDNGEGTADRAFHRAGSQRLLKERFTRCEALNQHYIRYAERHGYVETIPDRTVNSQRGYPVMCTRAEYGRIRPTVPLNYHVQSTAMWWTMKAMIRCQRQLDEWNEEVRRRTLPLPAHGYFLVMQVHDEMVFDFPKRAHPKVDPKRSNLARARIVQRLMEQGGSDIGIPTPVGVEYHHDNWSEGVTL